MMTIEKPRIIPGLFYIQCTHLGHAAELLLSKSEKRECYSFSRINFLISFTCDLVNP